MTTNQSGEILDVGRARRTIPSAIGRTAASNLVLLCPSHHTLVHEGQLFVQVHDAKLEFRNAYGLKLHPNPQREEIGDWQPEIGARVPRWDGSPLDLEFVVNSIYAAHPDDDYC